MRSMQRRAIAGGLIWAVAVVFAGTFALISVFDTMANARFEAALRDRHTQVVAALANAGSGNGIEDYLTDPAYSQPYSGRYWQLDGPDGTLASRSLFDTTLVLPGDNEARFHFWQGAGPVGIVRGARETIELDDGTRWVITVAETVATLASERHAMRQSLGLSFGLVGVFTIFGALTLTSVVLRPIRRLRQDVAARWDRGKPLEPNDYPAEVAPLVADIDALLHRNREIVERGRRQAADLAHALKTPSAALRNELSALAGKADLGEALHALDRIDAQIGRSLARMRAETVSRAGGHRSDLGASLGRLERLFRTMPESRDTDLELRVSGDLQVPVDRQDIEEMLGNLMENAFKWCDAAVRVTARRAGDTAVIEVEDDGPGIDPDKRADAMAPGARLDTAVPGTGLGLAISADLAHAYGGTLDLETSSHLGGLKVTIRLPCGLSNLEGIDTARHDATPPIRGAVAS
jgi:signal transduction histidine kinase